MPDRMLRLSAQANETDMKMKLGVGIIGKLFLWYALLIIIFYGTLVILYLDVNEMMRLSDDIINKHQKISSTSKKMIESLLSMEENEKKYALLKKKDYLEYFVTAKDEFESNLNEVMQLESTGFELSSMWRDLHKSYSDFSASKGSITKYEPADLLWVAEKELDKWIEKIKMARLENEQDIIFANIELNRWGQRAIRYGLGGLGISIFIGLIWILFIARTMVRPLRALRKGIRSITKDRYGRPIDIHTKDEFGELAAAFNEMTKRLKEEELMRAEFITTLSHEIRTPLTSIRESVNLIVEKVMGPTTPKQTKFLKIASTEIGRICELLNHLMHVSRLEETVFKVEPLPSDPLTFVIRSIDHLNPSAKAKRIHIDLSIPSSVPKIMGDVKHLQQVMLNLLGNAIKFSKSGRKIEVAVTLKDKEKQIQYSVKDNGYGIPAPEQSLIFDKYYRAKEVREHMDGVGLGLNISKQIVDAHNGKIWVKSDTGKGSTFMFTIPMANK
jgi:signal transduction histidine kinase